MGKTLMRNLRDLRNFRILIICLIILNVVSILSIYSSSYQGSGSNHYTILYRQIVWIVIFWLVLYISSLINYRLYFNLNWLIYGMSIILLIGVKLFGREIMGAQRWLSIFGLNFQPSEFSKLAVVILLASLFCSDTRGSNVFFKKVILPFILVSFSSILIFKQPDLGTASILILLFFMMGLASKIKKRYFISIIIVGLLFLPFGWNSLRDYQRKRLAVFINPNIDPLGAGYTIIQSKIAIGSGRFFGKGFLAGTQNQFNFLPERHTDFIFTVTAEEFGFLGGMFLLLIYFIILKIILDKAKEVKDSFAKFLCLGISSIFFLHIFLNIGMTMGFIPVVGLPLLLISYGGTHLMITAVLLGIFLNVVRRC